MPQLPSMIPLYRNASTRDEIRRILREIGADYEAHDTFSDEAVLSRMHLLFYLIARSLPSAETVVTRTLSTSQVIDYIGAHYPEPLSLSAVAERFSLSPEYLSRLFRKECGIGFSEFLTATRLSAARDRLLGDPSLSVTEVAFLCGYSDSNYFSTCFKREFGMSPKKFRGAQIA